MEGAAWQEATEISGPLITEPPLNEVNLPSHPQVSLLSSHLKFSTYPGACIHQTKWTPIDNEDLD